MEGAGIATFSQGMKIGGGNPLQEKWHIITTAWSASVAAGDINVDYGMGSFKYCCFSRNW